MERVYRYTIDREGRLWIEGTELTDPQVLNFFMKKMQRLANGQYLVLCMGETNLIKAEDVPYVVQSIAIGPEAIALVFPGNYRENLDPETLEVGRDNVLYCRIRHGEFKARFNRKTYLELSRLVRKDAKNNYYLSLGKHRYPIAGVASSD